MVEQGQLDGLDLSKLFALKREQEEPELLPLHKLVKRFPDSFTKEQIACMKRIPASIPIFVYTKTDSSYTLGILLTSLMATFDSILKKPFSSKHAKTVLALEDQLVHLYVTSMEFMWFHPRNQSVLAELVFCSAYLDRAAKETKHKELVIQFTQMIKKISDAFFKTPLTVALDFHGKTKLLGALEHFESHLGDSCIHCQRAKSANKLVIDHFEKEKKGLGF